MVTRSFLYSCRSGYVELFAKQSENNDCRYPAPMGKLIVWGKNVESRDVQGCGMLQGQAVVNSNLTGWGTWRVAWLDVHNN